MRLPIGEPMTEVLAYWPWAVAGFVFGRLPSLASPWVRRQLNSTR